MGPSNLAVLTQSHKIIASKKRAKKEQVKEVLFDEDARRDFLTGFHKRKVQKKEAAKQKAIQREKDERLEARRERRQMLAERAVQNAREVEKAYGGQVQGDDGSEDEWDGVGSSSAKGKQRADEREEEYEDEEQLATVTVVEDFDPDELLHGPKQTDAMDEDAEPERLPTAPKPVGLKSVPVKKASTKSSTKPKKIKYQTNAARKMDRAKQQKRKVEKAERAGGKASRRKGGKR